MREIHFKVTAKQKQFIKSTADETLYGGAAGGGKSYGQLIDAFLYAVRYPGSKQLILRRTFPELNRSLILVSYTLYPKDTCKFNASEHKYYFFNNSIIEFGYLENDKSVNIYQSAEYDVIRFDELTHFTEFQYTYMRSRLRGANPYPKYIKSSSNPGSEGHAWVKALFIEGKEPNRIYKDENGRTYVFIPAKVQDNEFLMKEDPGYIKRLESLDEDTKRALLYGDWDVFEGQYFTEFRKDLHVVGPFTIPAHWRRFRSVDWGYNDPCAVYWHAIAPDSRIYTYRELYINQTLASDVAKKIVELSEGERIDYTAASPDMWAKRGIASIHGESIAETFANNGVVLSKADNDRINGWQRMHEFLALAPDGLPYWQIFSTCTNLIRTLPSLVHDEKKVEDIADGLEDHAAESCRYALMSRPRPNSPALPQVPKDLPDDLKEDLENDPEALQHWLSTHQGS